VGAITTITAADAAATPVNHDFLPSRVDGDIAKFNEKSASHASGYWPLTLSLREPTAQNGSRVYRSQVNLAIPVLVTETINGVAVPKVAYTLRFNGEFILPADSTTQNRKDLRKLVVGVLDNALTKDVIEGLNSIY
jgi:hypothetical protein